MIEEILPAAAVAVEAFDDTIPVELFPAEAELVHRAVDKRRQEFATARRCAREALAALGHPPAPLLPGERGAPQWPEGVTGSITHCPGYRAAAVALVTSLRTIGIDAEPHEPLPDGILPSIASDDESAAVAELSRRDDGVAWDRLLFCAKEAVYKAWFPLTRRWLGFEEAEITIDRDGSFAARLLVDATVDGVPLTGFAGRWSAGRGLLLTAIAVPGRA